MDMIVRSQRRVLEVADFIHYDGTPAARALIAERAPLGQGGEGPGRADLVWCEAQDRWLELSVGWWVQLNAFGVVNTWLATAYAMTWTPARDATPAPDEGTVAAVSKLYAFQALDYLHDQVELAIMLARAALHKELDGASPDRWRALTAATAGGLLGGGKTHPDRVAGKARPAPPVEAVRIRRELDAPVDNEVAQMLVGLPQNVDGLTGTVRAVEVSSDDPHVLFITLELDPPTKESS